MKYDVIVIGGGLAGYVSAIRCLEKGKKTALINSGRSALHFSSGSVEVLAANPQGEAVSDPLRAVEEFPSRFPEHPYARVGSEVLRQALEWFQESMAEEGLHFDRREDGRNQNRITALGGVKATYLTQQYSPSFDAESLAGVQRVVLLSVEGFRDFQAELAVDNLQAHPLMTDKQVVRLKVSVSERDAAEYRQDNCRSIDFSRLLQDDQAFFNFANQIANSTSAKDLIVVPAIFGASKGLKTLQRLQVYTGMTFHEVPTMPPSLMGIRLEEALVRRFTRLGGVLLKGDCVTGGDITRTESGVRLERIRTRNLRDFSLESRHFILATGSFFSNGLRAESDGIIEPVFGLDTASIHERTGWYQPQFFTQKPHPFMAFGVETNSDFQPTIEGETVVNMHCCGAVLAHYNPVAQGCGGGVAIATACAVSDRITQGKQPIAAVELSQC